MNDFRKHDYGGPCPPSGTHRYFFKLYALDTQLTIGPNSEKTALEKAIQGHIISQTQIMGTYKRK
jgi:Raf kinase inhibitor-like YbhB/YbcL family protein